MRPRLEAQEAQVRDTFLLSHYQAVVAWINRVGQLRASDTHKHGNKIGATRWMRDSSPAEQATAEVVAREVRGRALS